MRSVGKWLSVVLPPVVVFIVVALAAQFVVYFFQIKPFNFPSPSLVWQSMIDKRVELGESLISTAEAAGIGFTLSVIVGICIAILLSTSKWVQRAFYPYTVFFQTVPIVAIAPLLVIWFDFGIKSVAVSAFIASVFPVIANTLAGLLSVDPALRDLFRLYGAKPQAAMFKLKLPWALPDILTGLRIAAGLAVIGAIVGEFVAGTLERGAGLGVSVLVAKRLGNTADIFADVLVASLLGLAMLALINLAGYFLLRNWHASEKE
jgi:NitT/TauT family transport system permease protein